MSKNVRRFIKILLNKNKSIVILSFFIMIVISILDLFIPQITRMILDDAIKIGNSNLLFKLIVIYGVIILLSSIFNIGLDYIQSTIKKKTSINLKIKLLKHISKLSGDYYTDIKTGNILNIMESDMFSIENFGIDILLLLIIDIFTAFVALIFLIKTQIDLLLVVLLLQLLLSISQFKFSKIISEETKLIRKSSGDIANLVQEYVSNIMNIVISKSTLKFFKQYINKEKKIIKRCIKLDMNISKNSALSNILSGLIILSTYGYGGIKIIKGQLTLGELIAFQQYIGMLIGPCTRIIKSNTRIQQSIVSINRIFSILDEPIVIQQNNLGKRLEEKDFSNIEFESVSFSYDNKTKVLDDINMKFEKGKTTALVGTSGSGKSTIIKLIFRLWDIDKGKITIDSIPLKDYNLKDLRKNISIITQELLLFDDSILNNITLGKSNINIEYVKYICKKVGIYNFINQLPDGFETKVGEQGVKLSGGQKQRISIARSLISNSKIVVFDEATSALDNVSQSEILENLNEFLINKTTIIIAHRLSTIINADKIYVLDHGKVIGEGSHEELIIKNDFYCNLLNTQAELANS